MNADDRRQIEVWLTALGEECINRLAALHKEELQSCAATPSCRSRRASTRLLRRGASYAIVTSHTDAVLFSA